ncbi:MAG TPA: hypothetical protein VK611_19590 [Acidimicrobiales bacterium]|nr:hypothetical protein [Acidimicrobiales bacterium]
MDAPKQPLRPVLSPGCRERLGDDRADRFDRLMDPDTGDPGRLMAEVRDDPDLGVALVECDTVDQLAPLFSDAPGTWSSEAEQSGPLGEASFGVAWTFETTHDDTHGRFNGIPPTGRSVVVQGYTVVGFSPVRGTLVVRRWVDWTAVLAQLGLTVNWRIPVTGPDPSP